MSTTHRARLLEAAVAAPGVTAISHHSAAHLHGLLRREPTLIHVIALRGHHPQPRHGVIVHHTRALHDDECAPLPWLSGVPVTRPATTVVLLGGYLNERELIDIVALVLEDGHCSAAELCDAAVGRLMRGRRGPRRVLDVLQRITGSEHCDRAVNQ